MNSIIPKLVPFRNNLCPVFKTVLVNRLHPYQVNKGKVLYYHGLHKTYRPKKIRCLGIINSSNKKRSAKNSIEEKDKTEWSALKLHNFKIPGLVHIQNLLKTQPNFKWRTLWNLNQDKVLEWPVFDRSKQYGNTPCLNIQNLVKSRLNNSISPIVSEKELKEIEEQKYLPQRVKNMGPDLTAVHFFYDRRGAIRLTGQNAWIVGGATEFTSDEQLLHCIRGGFLDEERYVSRCRVEALDCSNFKSNGIRYEGLMYLSGLRFIKWLSLKNQKHVNVWCLDRIAGLIGNTLEYLDISKCDLDIGCVIALSRMQALQMLIIKHPGNNTDLKKALSNLEELNPNLTVKSIGSGHIFGVPGVNVTQEEMCKIEQQNE